MTQPAEANSTSLFQVFAHADDDLYFVNPDLYRLLAAGHRVTSVYLTAGEADGRNVDTRDPLREQAPVDFAGYMEARQNGLRAAYATMVLGKREALWVREPVELVPGVAAERCYLSEAPHVQLFFLGLRMADAAHGFPADQPSARLTSLWDGRAARQPTLVAAESELHQPQALGREDVVAALAQLLFYAQPTLLWTMDPDPLHESYDEARGITSSDHADHTATAQFAREALRRHLRAGGRPPLTEHFTGYGNKNWPSNLSERSHALKKSLVDVYAGADGHACAHRYCGDLQLGDGADIRRYGWSTRSRYPQGTQWLHRQTDGRLAAYAVLGDQAAVWTETEAGAGRSRDRSCCPAVTSCRASLSPPTAPAASTWSDCAASRAPRAGSMSKWCACGARRTPAPCCPGSPSATPTRPLATGGAAARSVCPRPWWTRPATSMSSHGTSRWASACDARRRRGSPPGRRSAGAGCRTP
ncbi:PIG-L family deacetylase [Streptomyces yanii]|uniref:PIG-L family deacetylase n=1 Tax=Streptomyces yanii TaxID=78510 RepID=UPI0031E9C68E